MPSKRDAVIVMTAVAAGMMAFEDHQRAEITPTRAATRVAGVADANSGGCAAAVEYQKHLIRRMTLMAFGIAAPERRDDVHRLLSAAACCDDRC